MTGLNKYQLILGEFMGGKGVKGQRVMLLLSLRDNAFIRDDPMSSAYSLTSALTGVRKML